MFAQQYVQFVIGGVQKAGTSALAVAIRSIPTICIPEQKELHFFNREGIFRLNCFFLFRFLIKKNYHRHFVKCGLRGIWGDATPDYIFWETAPSHIWRYNPEMKWIVIIRHPIFRAYSAWAMNRSLQVEPLEFEEALAAAPLRHRRQRPYQHPIFSYLERGFYSNQIRRLFQLFDPERVLVLTTKEFGLHPQKKIDSIASFLGTTSATIKPKKVRVGHYEKEVEQKTFCSLLEQFKGDIELTSRLTGKDLSAWCDPFYDENTAEI